VSNLASCIRRRMKPYDLDEFSVTLGLGGRLVSRVSSIVSRNTKGPAYAGPFMSRSGLRTALDEATILS